MTNIVEMFKRLNTRLHSDQLRTLTEILKEKKIKKKIIEFYSKRKEKYKISNIFWLQKARGYANECIGWETGNALCV